MCTKFNLCHGMAWHGWAWCVYHVSSQRSTKCCVAKTTKTTIPLDFVGEQKAIVLLYLDKHTGRRYEKQFHATHFCSHSQHTRLVFYFFRFFFCPFFHSHLTKCFDVALRSHAIIHANNFRRRRRLQTR